MGKIAIQPTEVTLCLVRLPELLMDHTELEERVGDLVSKRKTDKDPFELLSRSRAVPLSEVTLAPIKRRIPGSWIVRPLDEERCKRL